jgi:hypothetical protein
MLFITLSPILLFIVVVFNLCRVYPTVAWFIGLPIVIVIVAFMLFALCTTCTPD